MPERKPPTAALMVGAAVTELSTGPDALELILAAHGPETDAAALLLRCMSKIAEVLIAAPDLRVPQYIALSPHDNNGPLAINLPSVARHGEAAAGVMAWTVELGGTPESLRESPEPAQDNIRVFGFSNTTFGARLYISCCYPASNAVPEIECADCRGTGQQRDGSPCADCLGKGRVAAVVDEFVDVDETCGDCVEGRCHWGGERSRASVAAVAADPTSDRPCGCARHEVSYRYRLQQLGGRGE